MTDETITLRVTPERLNRLKVRTMRLAQSDMTELFNFVAHFMVNKKGEFMGRDAALAILDQQEIGELKGIVEQVQTLSQDTAAPKVNGGQ